MEPWQSQLQGSLSLLSIDHKGASKEMRSGTTMWRLQVQGLREQQWTLVGSWQWGQPAFSNKLQRNLHEAWEWEPHFQGGMNTGMWIRHISLYRCLPPCSYYILGYKQLIHSGRNFTTAKMVHMVHQRGTPLQGFKLPSQHNPSDCLHQCSQPWPGSRCMAITFASIISQQCQPADAASKSSAGGSR